MLWAQKQKPLAFGEKPNPVGTWYFTSVHDAVLYWISTICRGRDISRPYHAKSLGDLTTSLNHFIIRGFSPWNGERVILGAKWKTLVRGWRRDCVVGGMETRFQWRKAHSRTAKCEVFHFVPRLFFMFLFLIPFTIRQQCIIIAPVIFHWANIDQLTSLTCWL